MSDIWYYAADDKEVGPLPLADLTAILARASTWRAGFEKWQRAATVPELVALKIKPPPPPPPQPQPTSSLPPALPRDRLIAPAGTVQSVNSASWRKSLIAVVVIAVGVAGVRLLSKTNSGSAIPEPDPSSIISGKTRDSFVISGMGPCLKAGRRS